MRHIRIMFAFQMPDKRMALAMKSEEPSPSSPLLPASNDAFKQSVARR